MGIRPQKLFLLGVEFVIVIRTLSLAVLTCVAIAGESPGQTPTLLKDINQSAPERGSAPAGAVDFYGVTLFRANDGRHGDELWRSDGSAAGTRLVKDIMPGPRFFGSAIAELTVVGATVFFRASDTRGAELWKTDGTPQGTQIVKDISPGSSQPSGLTAAGEKLFFFADRDGSGMELWRSDGTAAGTVQVRDIGRPFSGAVPGSMVALGGRVFFVHDDGVHGRELWVSDGTTAGTRMVRDLLAGRWGSAPTGLCAFGEHVYFSAEDGRTGRHLWRTDGTATGTRLFHRPMAVGSSRPRALTPAGGRMFFLAHDDAGAGLWVTDGRATRRVLANALGLDVPLTASGDRVFFLGYSAGEGKEPWVSDGTTAGTRRLLDIHPGSGDAQIREITAIGNRLVMFGAYRPSAGREPWISDGTPAGTRLLDIHPGAASSDPNGFVLSRGRVLFSARDGRGQELWSLQPGATAHAFGQPCGVGNRQPWLRATDPVLGATLRIEGGQSPGTTDGFLAVSLDPLGVATVGLGCNFYIDLPGSIVFHRFRTAGPRWSHAVSIPNDPRLLGSDFVFQAFFAPTRAPIGVDFTNGVYVHPGSH